MRDQRGWPWLHAVSSDLVFASRQLRKHRTASLAAMLSLGLAVGATTAAFRLLDAVLLRTLPVAEPDTALRARMELDDLARGSRTTATTSTIRRSAATETPLEPTPR